mgnify:CR=1 FL=1|tara:strand:+ start:3913 stop:4353 length:441 start_codon:yes stop_codon:yes gene_type:complete
MKGFTMANTNRKEYENGIITGKAYWTKLNKFDEYKDRYQMDIGDLTKDSVKLLESKGVKLKEKEGHVSGGPFVTPHTKRIIPVMDKDKNAIDVMTTLIGNGSEVKARVTFNNDHPFFKEYGTSLWLNKVQVVDLIEFSQDDDSDFD